MTRVGPADAEIERTASSDAALELDRVLRMIAGLAVTDVGRERLATIGPVRGEELDRRRARVTETEGLLDDGALVPPPDGPIGELVDELGAPQPELTGTVLLRWQDVLRTVRAAVEQIAASEEAPHLGALVADLADLAWLERRIGSTLDRRGRVRDDASPALADLRGRIGRLRKSTYGILEQALEERGELFSEDTVPLHDGRLVVMLKAGERGSIDGLVHGRSSSGRSLYFEPLAAVEANNALREAIADEEAERRRLLRELIDAVVEHRDEITAQVEVLAELDLLQAAARFADLARGRLLEISDGDLVLRQACHPLLAPQTRDLRRRTLGDAGHTGEVTPLDLELVGDDRLLVVTGPNAGGKTVALKTVGLAVALTACGLPVPAASGSRVPVPRRLVAVVGDEQDLMRDRSTFSGRLLRLQEAWEAAGPDGLVLIDELGSGTDPEEGSALAVALIERLVSEETTAIVTTHLVAVASTALDFPGASCAAMEFDRQTGRPTYRLIPGPPGGSEAIALGRQLGLASEWLDRARELVGEEHGKLTRLLAEVESLRAELEAEREELERARREADEERAAVAAERERLAERRRKLADEMERELEAFRRRVRGEMDQEVERLRAELEAGRRRGLAPAAVERMFTDAPEIDTPGEDGAPPSLAVGDSVRHARYGWQGVVETIGDDTVEISVRGKRVRVPPESLRRGEEKGSGGGKPGARGGRGRHRGAVETPEVDPDLPRELRLIGRRVEEALEELDAYLDQALLASLDEVRIVHGHGSGRLRRAVRQHLDSHRAVARHRPGGDDEGGDGATVVRLGS